MTVASGERSFSKLKLIKNYLRSTMQQIYLNNLAIMSIKSEISRGLNMNTVLKDFAEKKQERFFFYYKSKLWYDSINIYKCKVIIVIKLDNILF